METASAEHSTRKPWKWNALCLIDKVGFFFLENEAVRSCIEWGRTSVHLTMATSVGPYNLKMFFEAVKLTS